MIITDQSLINYYAEIMKNILIIVAGLPGSGKSTFAKALSDKINASYFNTDIIRKTENIEGYNEKDKKKVYDLMVQKIESGKNLILDGTFYLREIRSQFLKKSAEKEMNPIFIEVKADEELIKKRISQKREWSDADFNVYLRMKNEYEPIEEDHLLLDSVKYGTEEMVEKALKYISLFS